MLTAFPTHAYKKRIEAVKRRLAEQQLDALIVNYPTILTTWFVSTVWISSAIKHC